MRRAPVVAGATIGALAIGAAAATAAPLPISVDFTSGSVTVGNLPAATQSGTTRLVGTIESTTLVATFPASGVTFASATTGSTTVTPKATGTITGNPNAGTGTLDLSGPVSYDVSGGGSTCTIAPTAPITLAGSAIDPATGAYGASGSGSNTSLALPTTGCTTLLGPLYATSSTTLAYAGKLTVPGFIPTPTTTTPVVVPTTPSTPATTTPAPATPAKGTPKLSLTVARPAVVARGRSTVTKVVLRNVGTGTARSVTVRLRTAKGVTPRTVTKRYVTIGAGKTRTIAVRLRTTPTTARRTTVTATATGASKLSATRSTTLRLR